MSTIKNIKYMSNMSSLKQLICHHQSNFSGWFDLYDFPVFLACLTDLIVVQEEGILLIVLSECLIKVSYDINVHKTFS